MSQIQEGDQAVARSPDEIQNRISDLKERIALNNVQINIGTYAHPVMVPPREYELLTAQLNELRWFLGENVKITDGVQ